VRNLPVQQHAHRLPQDKKARKLTKKRVRAIRVVRCGYGLTVARAARHAPPLEAQAGGALEHHPGVASRRPLSARRGAHSPACRHVMDVYAIHAAFCPPHTLRCCTCLYPSMMWAAGHLMWAAGHLMWAAGHLMWAAGHLMWAAGHLSGFFGAQNVRVGVQRNQMQTLRGMLEIA
jgi:hypothetical protein